MSKNDKKVLVSYCNDLHGVFMKKFAYFMVEDKPANEDAVKLEHLLDEIIKVKTLIAKNNG